MMSSWAAVKAFLIVVLGVVVAAVATTVLADRIKGLGPGEEPAVSQPADDWFCPENGGEDLGDAYCCEDGEHGRRTRGDVHCCTELERCLEKARREDCYPPPERCCREDRRGCSICCGCRRRCPPPRWGDGALLGGGKGGSAPRTPPSAPATSPAPLSDWSSTSRRCRDGTFGSWYEQDLARLGVARGQVRPDRSDQRRGRFRRTIRVLSMPYFSRGPILYELRMDERGEATLATIWFAEDNRWLFAPSNAHRTMGHRGQHAAWRWAPLRAEPRQRSLKPDDAWRLWAIAGEINSASPYRPAEDDCMEEGNWVVVEEFPGRGGLRIAPLRSFNHEIDRRRHESDLRGFDEDDVSDRSMVRNNAETRFFCALAERARTPQRILVRGDVADVCHNMIRDPPLGEDDDGPDPYERS